MADTPQDRPDPGGELPWPRGLVMWSAAPASSASTASSSSCRAVIMITGTGDSPEIRRKTDSPCESPSCMSNRTSEGWVDRTKAIASSPPPAATTSNPSTDSVAANESLE